MFVSGVIYCKVLHCLGWITRFGLREGYYGIIDILPALLSDGFSFRWVGLMLLRIDRMECGIDKVFS